MDYLVPTSDSHCLATPEYAMHAQLFRVPHRSYRFPYHTTIISAMWRLLHSPVRLNYAKKANGQIELWVNGTSVFVADLIIRACEEGRIWGLQMRTYFGGDAWTWTSLCQAHARTGRRQCGLSVRCGTLRVSLAVAAAVRVGKLGSTVASPKLQHAYFGDFSVAITQDWPHHQYLTVIVRKAGSATTRMTDPLD
ncbi:hypothetical protein OH76DRAFT_1423375 [Lentinus brumalis]|uniref:Polysaccharide lyase 14 domain-containing protein n=1 Tax=Lentinus brumalis TaxID=2498619 RepID=A0A371CL63_9APHY|nr:hypothetical protein OH76DRAFT_1423375 [Polyporus brumalis]